MFELHSRLATDSYYLGDFTLSALLLSRDANYPWFILVPRREDISEIYQLDDGDRRQLLGESCLLSRHLQQQFVADKLNVAALGNVVPQLHLHHIVRYHSDTAWPAPIWGVAPAKVYEPEQLQVVQAKVKEALAGEDFRWRGQ